MDNEELQKRREKYIESLIESGEFSMEDLEKKSFEEIEKLAFDQYHF